MYLTSFNITKLGEVEIFGVLLIHVACLTSHITLTFTFQLDLDELTALLTNLESSFSNNPSVSNLNLISGFVYFLEEPHGEEKLLCHVAKVAKFLDDNKPNRHLKCGFALFQTSSILFNFI